MKFDGAVGPGPVIDSGAIVGLWALVGAGEADGAGGPFGVGAGNRSDEAGRTGTTFGLASCSSSSSWPLSPFDSEISGRTSVDVLALEESPRSLSPSSLRGKRLSDSMSLLATDKAHNKMFKLEVIHTCFEFSLASLSSLLLLPIFVYLRTELDYAYCVPNCVAHLVE